MFQGPRADSADQGSRRTLALLGMSALLTAYVRLG